MSAKVTKFIYLLRRQAKNLALDPKNAFEWEAADLIEKQAEDNKNLNRRCDELKTECRDLSEQNRALREHLENTRVPGPWD